jgi:hypothetical protein
MALSGRVEKGMPEIRRAAGTTASERYLARLADRTFLNLWAYPNVFIDKKVRGKGDGKELCDLLVVCGNDVLIFSDKKIAWPPGDDVEVSWNRWFRRAVQSSVDQIRGAERWIDQYPERIFVDRQCEQRLPLAIPPRAVRRVHGIVVALGAGAACREFFGEGSGSLMIFPATKGKHHIDPTSTHYRPFGIGDVSPGGSFIHVLDEATLDIVMRELDTISDLTAYLTKKEMFIRSGHLISASGEEDLLAYYLKRTNLSGEHDFVKDDQTHLGPSEFASISVGMHENYTKNPQYLAKKKADEISYLWDHLIETFTNHMLAGTTTSGDGRSFVLRDHEISIRQMALQPRLLRREYAKRILSALQRGQKRPRVFTAMVPPPNDIERSTGFFFVSLATTIAPNGTPYEKYRFSRRNLLMTYGFALLEMNRHLANVVGVASEPPPFPGDTSMFSEDLVYIEQRDWDDEALKNLAQDKKAFAVMQEGVYRSGAFRAQEYPDVP